MDIPTVLRVLLCLAGVIALIWFLRRRGTAYANKRRGDVTIRVAARRSLSQKASLVVVDVAEQRYTLGVTEHGVTVLNTEQAPAQTFDEHLDDASESLARPSFVDAFTSQLKNGFTRKGAQ